MGVAPCRAGLRGDTTGGMEPARNAKPPASKKPTTKPSAKVDRPPRVYSMSFASVYVLYVQKAAKKGRTQGEVDEVIRWLTGYSVEQLAHAIDTRVDFQTFFAEAPSMNPDAALIKGLVCGVRIEDIADPLMKKIRYLDRLVDELARGRPMEKILKR